MLSGRTGALPSSAALEVVVQKLVSPSLLVTLVISLSGCVAPTAPDTPVPTPATPIAVAPSVTPIPVATVAPTEAAAPTATTAAGPSAEATVPPTEVPPEFSGNLFSWLMRSLSAPEGWQALPCEGYPFALCVVKDNVLLGVLPMTLYPVETMPEFQELLAQAGVVPGPLDLADESQMSRVQVALAEFVEAYHHSIEADRAGRYGDQIDYVRQANESTFLGTLPG